MAVIRCRACTGTSGEVVLDLGEQPACEYFPPADDPGPDPVAPLRLWLCARCGLAQLADDADLPDRPEGVEPAALARQRADAVAAAQAAGLLWDGARALEGPTPHGGSWWPHMRGLGVVRAGDGEAADVVVDASFGIMHATDQSAALAALLGRLGPDGVLLLGFHSLAAIVAGRQWNAIRHGHYAYYSVPALQAMLAPHGMAVTRAWTFALYGGTVLIAAGRGGVPDASVADTVAAETAAGVLDPAALRALQADADAATSGLRRLAEEAAASGHPLYGYAAASRAVALIARAGLGPELLRGVADASPGKQGCRMPGTAIRVISQSELMRARPSAVLVFVSELLSEVRAALPEIEARGGHWVDAGAGVGV